jgi:transcriptional regulator with XRE-family HTH domain
MAPDLGSFSWHVIDTVQRLISVSGMTDAEVIKRSGMRRNTFYVKMRGETALTTEDLAKIAGALDIDPLEILKTAAGAAQPEAAFEQSNVRRLNVGRPVEDLNDEELAARYGDRLAADRSDPEQDLDARTP